MFKGKTVAAVAVVCTLGASYSHAQSLADAAKRAEEQRASVGASTKEYTNASLGGPAGYAALLGDNYLLEDHWEAYAHARDSLAQVRMQDFQMDKWLFERTLKVKDRFELEQIYGQDKSIMWALSLGRLTPRDYFKTDLAFAKAVEDYRLSKLDRENLPPARRANAQYVEKHNLASWARNNWNEQQLETRRVQRGFK
jgi:hypothetical protein